MPLMERRQEKRPWGLIVGLTIAATAGLLSLPLQVVTFRSIDSASREDVERNRLLVEQVKMLEEMGNADVEEHRMRNELLHADICRLIFDVAKARNIPVEPCDPPIDTEE